jgi:hypothetical protein
MLSIPLPKQSPGWTLEHSALGALTAKILSSIHLFIYIGTSSQRGLGHPEQKQSIASIDLMYSPGPTRSCQPILPRYGFTRFLVTRPVEMLSPMS